MPIPDDEPLDLLSSDDRRAVDASNEGYEFGRYGSPLTDCRHPVDSEMYVRWYSGWLLARQERAA